MLPHYLYFMVLCQAYVIATHINSIVELLSTPLTSLWAATLCYSSGTQLLADHRILEGTL